MTQIFREDGSVVPVTRIIAGPCVVTHVHSQNGKRLVQIGFGKSKHLNKPMAGHLKDLAPVSTLRAFVSAQDLNRGDILNVGSFAAGERVDVTGVSKGKGFQGVVKRHHFAGGPASHGHKDNLRMPGSIGATDSQRVYKGTRMGGHMGLDRVTVKNLEIVAIDADKNELLVKGAIPGARGGLVLIHIGEGEMTVEIPSNTAAEESVAVAAEAPITDEATAEVSEGPTEEVKPVNE